MFSKVLVANRGEIAVRINQTLHAMGIVPVAVYSDPDAGTPHVLMAEQAVALPGSTAEETYLSISKLVQAARIAGSTRSTRATVSCRRIRSLPGPAGTRT